jgi:hypothetical protein
MVFDSQNNIYTATAQQYQVTKWDPELQKLLVLEKKYKPIPLTEEEIEAIVDPALEGVRAAVPGPLQQIITENVIKKAVELAEFPPAKNAVNGLKVLDDQTILVIHDANLVTGMASMDIFNKNGRFLGSVDHDFFGINRMVFKNGYGYTIETNDEEENELIRYRYKLVPKS